MFVAKQQLTSLSPRREILAQSIYRGPRGILCTRGEKEHTSKRVSIVAPDNAISKAKCATCETATPPNSPLHAPLARVNSPVLAVRRMLSFSAKKTRRFSRVFAVKREIPCNQLSGTPRDTVYSRGKGVHEQKSEHYCLQ